MGWQVAAPVACLVCTCSYSLRCSTAQWQLIMTPCVTRSSRCFTAAHDVPGMLVCSCTHMAPQSKPSFVGFMCVVCVARHIVLLHSCKAGPRLLYSCVLQWQFGGGCFHACSEMVVIHAAPQAVVMQVAHWSFSVLVLLL